MFARPIANNQAKDVSSLNDPSDNSSPDNSSVFDDILLAVREPSVIRGQERSRAFMSTQKLLFERSSQRKSSGFERVKEIFDIDSIDISEQTVDIPEQTADIAVQQEQVEQMKQPIRRGRDRSPGREPERRCGGMGYVSERTDGG